ncbi:hypothetical protein IFM89_016543 [Coptis chinensis]|uniref:Pentatricopeptide repeat-containing protein n=1 Tax=Coptis chinensis TaxID=261450 RepID=A0A835IAH5_9MAGN|nr:hypothetical protein IFM89_016543 [Coptis chinensis]
MLVSSSLKLLLKIAQKFGVQLLKIVIVKCNGKLDEAKKLYDYMLKNDLVPGWVTFEALIPCVCEKGDLDLALKLCEVSLNSNCHISAGTMQVVVYGLVKESKIEEGLVEIAWSKTYFHSKLKMPKEDE